MENPKSEIRNPNGEIKIQNPKSKIQNHEVVLVVIPSPNAGKEAAESLRTLVSRVVDGPELEDEMHDIRLALTEAIANVMDHAFSEDDSTPITVTARLFSSDSSPRAKFESPGSLGTLGTTLEIHIIDGGRPPDPDRFISRDLDDIRSGGLGLRLIAQLMDRVEMRIRPGENCFSMIRSLGKHGQRHATQETFHVLRRESAEGCELFLYGSLEQDRVWKIDVDELVSMRVTINFAGLSFIDAAGIREILALADRLESQGSILAVAGIRDNIRRALAKCGILDRLAWGEAKLPNRSRVLLVERDPLFTRQVSKALAEKKIDLRISRDILSVQNEMHHHRPDLVILSMDLPFDEGENLLGSIRSNPAWVSVPLILTGRGADFAKRLATMQEDVDDYCPIPLDTSELTFRIQRVLDRYRGAPGSLSLLRALGRRFEPEVLAHNIADQIDELQELNTFFFGGHRSSFLPSSARNFDEQSEEKSLSKMQGSRISCFDRNDNNEMISQNQSININSTSPQLEGWMRWGPLSLGSFFRMESNPANGSCLVVLGRGVKSGISSIIAASHVAGLAALAIEDCPDDIDAIASQIAAHARKLVSFVDPYYIAFARLVPGAGWMFYSDDGPHVGIVRGRPHPGAQQTTIGIGSFSVDRPPRTFQKIFYPTLGPARFIAPGFGLDTDRIWKLPADELRRMQTDVSGAVDFWVADIC